MATCGASSSLDLDKRPLNGTAYSAGVSDASSFPNTDDSKIYPTGSSTLHDPGAHLLSTDNGNGDTNNSNMPDAGLRSLDHCMPHTLLHEFKHCAGKSRV